MAGLSKASNSTPESDVSDEYEVIDSREVARDHLKTTLMTLEKWWDTEYDLAFSNADHPKEPNVSINTTDEEGNTLLHLFATRWERWNPPLGEPTSCVRWLLEKGVNAKAHNSKGQTMVHTFLTATKRVQNFGRVFNGRLVRDPRGSEAGQELGQLIELLRGFGFDIETRDDRGQTILLLTAATYLDDFVYTLRAGASIMTRDDIGKTVLHVASAAGRANTVAYILELTGHELLDLKDFKGRRPLHEACTSGHLETVAYLVRQGADLAAKDHEGRTPLHACMDSNCGEAIVPIIRYLLESGAVDGPRPWGHEMVFDQAVLRRCKPIVRVLAEWDPSYLAHKYHTDVNSEAARRGAVEEMKAEFLAHVSLLCRTEPALKDLSEDTRLQISREPRKYLDQLKEHDIQSVVSDGMVSLQQDSGYSRRGFMQKIAQDGRIDLMRHLGSLAKEFDDRPLVASVLYSSKQKESRVKLLHEDFRPLIACACTRETPNMLMVQLLVEELGLNVNAPTSAGLDEETEPVALKPHFTPLHVLAAAHSWWQLEAISFLVAAGADIDARDNLGRTPLHIACDKYFSNLVVGRKDGLDSHRLDPGPWKLDCVELLLRLGADIDGKDKSGRTPLHYGASSPEILRALLDAGASLGAGKGPLMFSAIRRQSAASLRLLLDAGCDVDAIDEAQICEIEARHEHQIRHALLCVCFAWDKFRHTDINEGRLGLIQMLLENGADPHAALKDDETLLHYIFAHAKHRPVTFLLKHARYLDLERRDRQGRTALLAACDSDTSTPMFNYYGARNTAQPVVFQLLSTLSVNARAQDSENKTMLHHLCANTEMEVQAIIEILEYPICRELINHKDDQGFTAIQYALRQLRPILVKKLLDLGADLLAPDPTGNTALHRIAKQFFDADFQLKPPTTFPCVDPNDHRAALETQSLEIWQQFLDLGGDRECRNNDGNTPFLEFCGGPVRASHVAWGPTFDLPELRADCHVESYGKMFAEADIFARNYAGESGLHIIAGRSCQDSQEEDKDRGHDTRLFQYMLQTGLDPLDQDKQGRTALDRAALSGQKEILELCKKD